MKLREAVTLFVGSKSSRAKAGYQIARRKAAEKGFYVYSDHMVWKEEPFFRDAANRTANVKGIPHPRCFVLQSCLRSIANVEGDVAECGVRNGRSAIFMLTADMRPRRYHLFDSFAGLSEPAAEDRPQGKGKVWKKGDLTAAEAATRANLADFADVEFHVGWIPETLPAVSDRRFALVHIDVDLYEPTRDSLAFFYDRLEPFGIIVCDDYGSNACPGARKAFDDFFAARPEGIVELPTGQAIVTKRP